MKDPAFLFYPNDWMGGTMGWTFEEKGAYLELLLMQFNRGHMTSHMIGQVLGQNGGQLWVTIQTKFEIDSEGKYFNRRLEEEKNKRKAFTDSRKNNIKGKNQYSKEEKKTGHMDGHMTSHMENENENENIYSNYIDKLNKILNTKYRGDSKSKKQFNARIKEGFSVDEMIQALTNATKDKFHIDNKYKYLTPEFFTRPDKIESFRNRVVSLSPTSSDRDKRAFV